MLDATPHILRVLLRDRVVGEAQVASAHLTAGDDGPAVLAALVDAGAVDERTLTIARAHVCEYPFVDLDRFDVDIRNASLLPRRIAERLGCFPLFVVEGVATVAMLDPFDLTAAEQIRQLTGCEIEPVLCVPSRLRELSARAYSMIDAGEEDAEPARGDAELVSEEEPVVAAVNQILGAAADAGASDVHLSPDEAALHLRFRVDGVLRAQQGPPRSAHAAMVQRIKVLARLDLTETRRPQDGKFRFTRRGNAVDVRVSTVPTIHGENVVMRLLRSGTAIGSVESLGMPPAMLAWFRGVLESPYGMVLVTGPTGSGKTTTLYTALAHLNSPQRNIMTIEDPVEYRLPMIRQVQVNAAIDVTFAGALRAILRQDPDVVLVGEIRDGETARIAAQAAMTGHLVLSTLHTNDAAASITRLRDLGVPAFAINGGLLGAIAQRLVRRLCPECAAPARPDPAALAACGVGAFSGEAFASPVGCESCGGSGYRGRCAVFEWVAMDQAIRGMIERGASEDEVRGHAASCGAATMADDGLAKARRGVTSLDEVRRLVAVRVAAPQPGAVRIPA